MTSANGCARHLGPHLINGVAEARNHPLLLISVSYCSHFLLRLGYWDTNYRGLVRAPCAWLTGPGKDSEGRGWEHLREGSQHSEWMSRLSAGRVRRFWWLARPGLHPPGGSSTSSPPPPERGIQTNKDRYIAGLSQKRAALLSFISAWGWEVQREPGQLETLPSPGNSTLWEMRKP